MLHFLMEFLKDPVKYQALMTVSDQAMNMEGSNWHSGTITGRYGGKLGLSQQDEEEDEECHSRKDK
jgi:hypothetical protein